MSSREFFSFPNPVNEKAARSVAAGVVALAVMVLLTQWVWLAVLLAIGFALRVAGGPRYSPLGRLAVHVISPRLGAARMVPGPPKRFAQTIGLLVSSAAAVSLFVGASTVATVLLGVLVVFALLESAFGFCFGCWVFGQLMRLGVIPEDTCAACNDISLRPTVIQHEPQPHPQGQPQPTT